MLFHKWWPIRSILKYSSPLISILEKGSIKNYGTRAPENPVIFIIGAPRSGSTIIYQLITSMLDVAYIDNLTNLARRNPFTGMRLSRYFFGDRPHSSFTSSYGQTDEGGLHAPAEALFPYLWLPTDRHFTGPSDLTAKQKQDFVTTMNSLVNLSAKPLVIKNLSFSMRIQLLKELLPEACYIVLKRNPFYIAQSILLAMQTNKVKSGQIWSIRPRDHEQITNLQPEELAVRQVNLIEKQIAEDLKDVDKSKILYIHYESLDRDPQLILERVINLVNNKTRQREDVSIPEITIKDELKVPEEKQRILKEHIDKLEWNLHNS